MPQHASGRPSPAAPHRSPRVLPVVAAVLCAVAVATLAVVLWRGLHHDRPTAASEDAAPTPPPGTALPYVPLPATGQSDDAQSAAHAPVPQGSDVEAALQVLPTLLVGHLGAPDEDVAPDVDARVQGPLREELDALYQEYALGRLRVEGSPTIDGPTILDVRRAGSELTVGACVDNGPVRVLDENDVPVGAATGRSSEVFTLVLENGTWTVTARTFADPPDC